MSWDSYIDNLVAQCVGAGGDSNCSRACIIGIDGGAKWTTETHAKALKLTADEAAKIASCFKRRDFSEFQANGIRIEGHKYQFLRVEDNKLVLCKAKDIGAVTLQATKTAIVIALCPDGKQPGIVNKGVGVIGDYLESMNM